MRFVPELPAEQLGRLRRELHPDQGIVWTPVDGRLVPVKVRIGLVGDKETEVSGDDIRVGTTVAVPRRSDGGNPRFRGLRLF